MGGNAISESVEKLLVLLSTDGPMLSKGGIIEYTVQRTEIIT